MRNQEEQNLGIELKIDKIDDSAQANENKTWEMNRNRFEPNNDNNTRVPEACAYVFLFYLSEVIYNAHTCSSAGPSTGTMNPWYIKSSNCCLIRSCATWTTALQNSSEFMNNVNFGMSATSSGVIRYQSMVTMSKVFGSDEYRPPRPVTSTGHIDE